MQLLGGRFAGPYLIIAPQTASYDAYKDYFKVDKITAVTTVPEPATLALVAFGLTGVGFARRRTR